MCAAGRVRPADGAHGEENLHPPSHRPFFRPGLLYCGPCLPTSLTCNSAVSASVRDKVHSNKYPHPDKHAHLGDDAGDCHHADASIFLEANRVIAAK